MKKFYIESELVFEEKSTHGRFEDLEGQKFGRLTVLGFTGRVNGITSYWFYKCDCGNISRAQAGGIKGGTIISCGCLRGRSNITHGHTIKDKSPTYETWGCMIQRCQNLKNSRFIDYGGRGITVCERWLKFENFLEDMGERPKGMTIDRKNRDGNYEPGNCRWATKKEQQNNCRSNRLLIFNGRTQNIKQWAEELGINYETLWHRINSYNWPTERALLTPIRNKKASPQS